MNQIIKTNFTEDKMILTLLKNSELSSKQAYAFLLETFKYARTINKGIQSDLDPVLVLSGYMTQEYQLELANLNDIKIVENAANEFIEKDKSFNKFADIQAERRTIINQISFQYDKYLNSLKEVNSEWVKSQIEKFGLKDAQIITDLAFDKSDFSNYMSGKKYFTPRHKRALIFYFLSFSQ
jgi:hypothetical protein